MKILLLEDSVSDSDLLKLRLVADGLAAEVTTVTSREAFIAELAASRFDIVLSDYAVPGCDGPTALGFVRQRAPDLPFVFVSGALGEERAIELLKRGATDYVLKSNLGRLVPCVERACREANERAAKRRAEERLRESEERYRFATRATEDAVWDWNIATGAVHWNEAVSTAFGYPREPLVLDRAWWLARLHSEDAARVSDGLRAMIDGGGSEWRDEYRFRRHDGRYATVVDRGYIARDPAGRATRAVGAMQDVTAQREDAAALKRLHARAEEANRLKDEFLSTVSHELRTPLTAMLGWVQMLRAGFLTPDKHARALETVERNARAQGQLIEDLLDVSRIMSGKLRIESEPVALAAIVDAALETVRPAAVAKDIRFEIPAPLHRDIVLGDAGRLQQVLWNLLANAVKFTPKGGVVGLRVARADADLVEISVTDSGQGISVDFLPYVFERFRQADGGTSREHGGLGLGLAIVRHLVELHGGTVSAASEGQGRGATFTVRLPRVAPSRTSAEPAPPPVSWDPPPFECPPQIDGLSVLIVEDDPDTRELLRALLERCGVRVTSAGSATEALAALRSARPDVLLSDVGMPGEDGYALIRQIRALAPEDGGKTPAVALTAYTRPEDRRRILLSGFNMYVPKPIDPAELVVVLLTVAGRALRA